MVFIPDPLNYEMKKNPPKNGATYSQPHGLTDEQLAQVDSMAREELIALVQRCNPDYVGIALLTEDEIAEAMLLKLAVNALTSRDAKQTLENINAWLDRKKGKAIQRIDQRIASFHTTAIPDMTTPEILAQLTKLQDSLPANVKLIEGKVEVTDYQQVSKPDLP